MKNFVAVFLSGALLIPIASASLAQGVAIAPVAAATAGAYAGKKLVGTCFRHPILCAATVAVGAGYIHHTAANTRKLDAETPECNGGYVSLYRAVGVFEHAEISAIQRYVIVYGGMTKKEFFFDPKNAQWVAEFNQSYERSTTKEVFIVTSKICSTTVAKGETFSDANRPAIAFDSAALKTVNLDASRTGGIQTVWTTGPAK